MATRFSIETVFKAIDRFSAPVSKMQNRIGRFTRTAGRQFNKLNRTVNKFGAGVKRTGIAVVASLALITGGMVATINKGADFEQALVGAAAKFPEQARKGTQAFLELEAVARKVGATTEFTATQAAEGLNFLAFAGFNVKQAIAALPGVIDLATAAQIELSDASDIATDTLGAFGLATKDPIQLMKNLARVNDVLAKTTTSANTDMIKLFETIKKGGPVANSAGASIETFAALAGTMANSSLKASEAGSVIKNMFLRLSGPTSTAAKLLRRLGVETKDSDGNLRDIVDILGDLDKGLGKFGTAEKTAILSELFGARAVTGVSILLQTGTKNLRRYREQLENATGATSSMASMMRDTTRGEIFNMTSAIEGVTISLFKMNQERIDNLLKQITTLARNFDTALQSNQELGQSIVTDLIDIVINAVKIIGTFIGAIIILKFTLLGLNVVLAFSRIAMLLFSGAMVIAAGVKGVLLLIGSLVGLVGTLGIVRAAVLAFGITLFANPIGLVILAITSLIGIGVLLVSNWDNIKSAASSVWGSIVDTVRSSIDKIKSFIDVVTQPFKDLFAGIDSISTKFSGFFGGAAAPTALATPEGLSPDSAVGNVGQSVDPTLLTPQEVTARQIEERRETSFAELVIRGDTSLAELSGFNNKKARSSIRLDRTGSD